MVGGGNVLENVRLKEILQDPHPSRLTPLTLFQLTIYWKGSGVCNAVRVLRAKRLLFLALISGREGSSSGSASVTT
jgi:hypothetical protein